MFATLMQFYNNIIQHLSGGDAVAKGLVTVWLLSTLGYLSRSLPKKAWIHFLRFISVELVFSSRFTSGHNNYMMSYVEDWFIRNNEWTTRNLRHTMADKFDEELKEFSPGIYYVKIGWKIFRVVKSKDTDLKSEYPQFNLYVSVLGRNTKAIEDIVEKNKVRENIRYFYVTSESVYSESWQRQSVITKSQNLFLDPEIKRAIDEKIIFFRDNKQWFLERGLPYKLTIILHGEPGTGKSSIIKYISDTLNSDLRSMNLSGIAGNRFEPAMRAAREGMISVISIEDFEESALSRDAEPTTKIELKAGALGLDVILNVLQGVNPLENIVTVMSTNHIDRVDPALIRRGRCDLLLEVGRLKIEQVKEFFEYSYKKPFPFFKDLEITPIKAGDMHSYFLDNPDNPDGFMKLLLENHEVKKPSNRSGILNSTPMSYELGVRDTSEATVS